MKSTPRTTSLNEPDIRPARNHAEAEEIGSLLLEEIAHPGFIPGPEFVWQGQGFLRPTLIPEPLGRWRLAQSIHGTHQGLFGDWSSRRSEGGHTAGS